jgi:energy-coupling factor transporter ATP-binding protein EcfA2
MADSVTLLDFTWSYSSHGPPVLRGVSFAVRERSICGILGAAGAGKTTLLHALSGVLGSHHRDAPAQGSMTIDGVLHQGMPREVLFPTVGLVLDEPVLQISGMKETVFEEVSFTLDALSIPPAERDGRVLSLLRELGIAHLKDRHPANLSGGELQRVALSTILVASPRILLLDEPMSSLDASSQLRLQRIARNLKTSTTIIFTDSQVDAALMLADQIVVFNEGNVVFDGTRSEFALRIADFPFLAPSPIWKETIERLLGPSGTSLRRRMKEFMP